MRQTTHEPAMGTMHPHAFARLMRTFGRTPRPAPPPTPATLTPSQADFLERLTADQRGRLEQNPKLRAELLEWFRYGPDRILEAEALRQLHPTGGPEHG